MIRIRMSALMRGRSIDNHILTRYQLLRVVFANTCSLWRVHYLSLPRISWVDFLRCEQCLPFYNLSTKDNLGGREGTIIYNPNLLQWTSSYPTPAHTCACFTTFEESLCHHRGATYWLNTWIVDFIILPLSKEEEEKWPSMLTVIQCTLPPCLATVVVLKCWITWTMCNGSYRTSSYFTTLWRQFRDFSSSSSFTFFNIPHILLKHFCAGLHAPCIYTALLLHQKT